MAEPRRSGRLRDWGLVLLGLVVVMLVAVAWLERPSETTARDAVQTAEDAFVAAGLRSAVVDPDAQPGTYTDERGDAIAVWRVAATLDGAPMELWLARDDGEPVFLDDVTVDGTARLLTQAQFDAIDSAADNPALARQVRRNLVVTAAAVAILVVVVILMMTRHPTHPRPLEQASP
jgi:hypothetical protein